MNAIVWILLALYGVVLALWLVRLVLVLRFRSSLVFLSPGAAQLSTPTPPLVSVLIPVRNEEKSIGRCLESILGQDYPNLEVLVIDDRSTDRTAELVQLKARQDGRLRLLQVTQLPEGWTGKTHALHQGAPQARGEWLLFVDADTWHHPQNLRVLLEYARREQADLVSLLPGMSCRSFWEKVVQPLAGVILMIFYRPPRVNNDRLRDVAFANGQYILVRRAAYDQVGGHEAVRSEFVEDINLGRLIKRTGFRIRVAVASDLTWTRMYSSLEEIVQGWSRILYAAVDHRPWKLLGVMAAMIVFSLSVFVTLPLALGLLLAGHDSREAWLLLEMSLLHQVLIVIVMGQLYAFTGRPRRYLIFYLLACLAMLVILGRSIAMCFTHRVTWRGTTYGPEMRRPRQGEPEPSAPLRLE